jgi:outer membrane protein assembly factor BamB
MRNFNHPSQLYKSSALYAAVLGICSVFISGCGAKDNTPLPHPLTTYPFSVQPNILWKTNATLGSGTGTTLGLSQTNSNLITVGYNGEVMVLDKNSGKIIWAKKINHQISARAVGDDQRVYIPTREGDLVALNILNGEVIWSAPLSSTLLSGVCVQSGVVVVHANNGDVVGLDATTGVKLWSYKGSSPAIELQGSSEPVANSAMVYIGNSQGQMFGFDLQSGEVKWNRPIAIPNGSTLILRMIDINSTPLLGPSGLYAVSYHGNLAALNPYSGDLLWQRAFSAYQNLSADFAQQAIFMTDEKSDVFNIDASTGATRWKQDGLEYRNLSAPSYLNSAGKGHLLVGDYQGYVHVISESNGTLEARIQVDRSAIASQGISDSQNSRINYFVTRQGKVIALTI